MARSGAVVAGDFILERYQRPVNPGRRDKHHAICGIGVAEMIRGRRPALHDAGER
jgi:hypothetical protein